MAKKEWTSDFPANLDTTSNMEGVGQGDTGDPSQLNAVRDAVISLENEVGSDNLEDGTLRKNVDRIFSVLDSYNSITIDLDAYATKTDLDAYASKDLLDDYATISTSELHIYVDGTSGDDANDGLTVGSPKKTFAAAWNALPHIIDSTTVLHCSGTFAESHFSDKLSKIIADGGWFIVTGEGDETTILGSLTSTGSTTLSIADTTQSWTVNQYQGYWVKFTSGAQSGLKVLIDSNTSDTLNFITPLGSAPGTGTSFEIVRPKTTFSNGLHITFVSGVARASVLMQNLYISGPANIYGPFRALEALNIMVNGPINFRDIGYIDVYEGAYGFPDVINDWDSSYYGYISAISTLPIVIKDCRYVSIYGGFSKRGIQIYDSLISFIGQSGGNPSSSPWFRSTGKSLISNCKVTFGEAYSPTDETRGLGMKMERDTTDSAGVGLTIVDSSISLQHGCIINNYTSHGIEAKGSYLKLSSAFGFGSPISGTNGTSSGAGVYAHSRSFVTIENGAPPTLTGGVGDLSFDGTTQASTWAAIDGGTPVTNLVEMSSAKEE